MKEQIRMKGVPGVTPSEFLKLASTVMGRRAPRDVTPMMLWGAPGIGKSDTIQQLAERLEKLYMKPCIVHDVRLSLYSPTDLKGMPFADKVANKTTWLRPGMLDMDESDGVINLLFLDEITNASQSVAHAAYQLILDRKIENHKLPDNCYVICAGNRVADKSATTKMSTPLANRLSHFEVIPDVKSWQKWALDQVNYDPRVIGFISYKPEALFTYEPGKDEMAFPTPRSWSVVARMLHDVDEVESMLPLVEANVGNGAAGEFFTYTHCYAQLPDVGGIIEGRVFEVPSRPDILYALCTAVPAKFRDLMCENNEVTYVKGLLTNTLSYLSSIPPEFQVLALQAFVSSLKDINVLIMENPLFKTWIVQNRDLLEVISGD